MKSDRWSIYATLLLVILTADLGFVDCGSGGSSPSATASGRGNGGGGSNTGNVIVQENARARHPSWQLTNPGTEDENPLIEGFASATGVNRGDSNSCFVNTSAPSYTNRVGGVRQLVSLLRPGKIGA